MQIYKREYNDVLINWQWKQPNLKNFTHIIKKNIPRKKCRILDVGCGTGRTIYAIAQKGHKIDGIDSDANVIKIASEIFKNNKNVSFEVSDFTAPQKIKKGYYDLVICSEVLEHVSSYRKIISNIHRSLKPNGIAIFTVPLYMKKFTQVDKFNDHLRRFELIQIIRGLKQFKIKKMIITGYPFYQIAMKVYLLWLRATKFTNANPIFWTEPISSIAANLTYPLVRLDNFFNWTKLGDSLIAVVQKADLNSKN